MTVPESSDVEEILLKDGQITYLVSQSVRIRLTFQQR